MNHKNNLEINHIFKEEDIVRHIITEMDRERWKNGTRKNTNEFNGKINNRDKEERKTWEEMDSRRGIGFEESEHVKESVGVANRYMEGNCEGD